MQKSKTYKTQAPTTDKTQDQAPTAAPAADPPIILRKPTIQDLYSVIPLYVKAASKETGIEVDPKIFLDYLLLQYRAGKAGILIAYQDGRVVGGVAAQVDVDPYTLKRYATIIFIYVLKEYRGSDGEHLLRNAIEAWAKQAQAPKIRLNVSFDNEHDPAAWLEAAGYTKLTTYTVEKTL